jgi:hypothetical protein
MREGYAARMKRIKRLIDEGDALSYLHEVIKIHDVDDGHVAREQGRQRTIWFDPEDRLKTKDYPRHAYEDTGVNYDFVFNYPDYTTYHQMPWESPYDRTRATGRLYEDLYGETVGGSLAHKFPDAIEVESWEVPPETLPELEA